MMADLHPTATATNLPTAPSDSDVRAALRGSVDWAILAPSGHNTQPWRFRLAGDTLELRADRSRSLPIADPDDRELTIACGAALFHLRLALRQNGFAPAVELLPDPRDPDLLARVRTGAAAPASDEETALFRAIPSRRTNRKPFGERALPGGLADDLWASAEREGAWMRPIEGDHRTAVADLVEEGDRIQWADRRFRSELAQWLRPARRGDGLSTMYMYGLGPLVVRWLDLGKSTGGKDRELAIAAPLLMVIGTDGDGVRDWLTAGQALERVLLRARVDGVDASYFNQPIQVAGLRPRLAETIGMEGWPQVLLRLGYGPEVPPSPRQPVRCKLTEDQTGGATDVH